MNSQEIIKIIGYVTGSIATLSMIGLSIYKITQEPTNPTWISLLSSLVCIYVPSPIDISAFFTSKRIPEPLGPTSSHAV